VNAGKQVAVDDIVAAAFDYRLFVGICSARFVGGDKGRADVGKVCPHGLRGQYRTAAGNGAG